MDRRRRKETERRRQKDVRSGNRLKGRVQDLGREKLRCEDAVKNGRKDLKGGSIRGIDRGMKGRRKGSKKRK